MALPKLPRVKLDELDYLHEDLVSMFLRFEGKKLTPELCLRLARNLSFALEGGVNVDHAFQTLMQYENKELNKHWSSLLARQVVARQYELAGGPLQLFDKRPVRDEWVALEIMSSKPCDWRGKPAGIELTFYCLTGHPAGHLLAKKFPENWIAYLAYRIGFSRRLRYNYETWTLEGLRFFGYLLGAKRDPADLDFEDWVVNPAVKRANQLIIKKRQRFEVETGGMSEDKQQEYSCPFDLEIYCSDCRHSTNECIAVPRRGLVKHGQ